MKLLGSGIRSVLGLKVLPLVADTVTFRLAKINLVRAGCPREVEHLRANQTVGVPVVIVNNKRRLGEIKSTGYAPPGVVAAGAATRSLLLSKGQLRAYAWLQAGVDIQADDAVSSSELMEKLTAELGKKFFGPTGAASYPNSPYPYVREVYPFESYFIYAMKGSVYRQHYTLDPTDRSVRFIGVSIPVEQKFVDACGDQMARTETGARYAFAPMKSHGQSVSLGAKNSELVSQIIRNWKNINDAVNTFLNAVTNGTYKPMRPSFYPVQLTDDNKIASTLAASNLTIIDFAAWSASVQSKKKGSAHWEGVTLGN